MWFMNKVVNPLVRLILRSPLHGMMSATILLITYRGRKSGKEYTLPVQYAQEKKTIYIMPGAPDQKTWWRNLRGGAPVQLLLAGEMLAGVSDVLEGSTHLESIAHALDIFLQRFPAAAKHYNVHSRQDGLFDQDDLKQAAASTVVVVVSLE